MLRASFDIMEPMGPEVEVGTTVSGPAVRPQLGAGPKGNNTRCG